MCFELLWYTMKKYTAQATWKMLARTVATCLVRNPNMDIVTAATFLGYSRLDTIALYSRPSDEDLEKVVEEISRRVSIQVRLQDIC